MSKAVLELETPGSCKKCVLWRYCFLDKEITIFADRRSPDCPLKIIEDEYPKERVIKKGRCVRGVPDCRGCIDHCEDVKNDLRWKAEYWTSSNGSEEVLIFMKCPKCGVENRELEEFSNYCPSCGVKLLPPEGMRG